MVGIIDWCSLRKHVHKSTWCCLPVGARRQCILAIVLTPQLGRDHSVITRTIQVAASWRNSAWKLLVKDGVFQRWCI